MYIKNRRNSNKFKGFGSYQTLWVFRSYSATHFGAYSATFQV
jgi:hypothetical protein